MTDVIRKRYGYSPPTYGRTDTEGAPLETTLTMPQENSMDQTLDYILLIGERPPPVNLAETGVVPFKVFAKKYTQISDHCGLHCTFQFT